MKWLFNLALKHTIENKSRSVLTFISIALASLVITDILITGATMRARTATSIDVIYGSLAIFLGAFLVGNNFMMSFEDRLRSFGILKTLGLTKKQMAALVVAEAIILGAIAITVGVVIGAASAYGIYLLAKRGPLITPFVLPPTSLAISFTLSLSMVFLASLAPAIKAAKLSALEAVHSRVKKKSFFDKHSVKIGAITMALSLIGVFFFGLLDRGLSIVRTMGAVSIFSFLLGTSLFSPRLIQFFLWLVSGVIKRFVNNLGQLASENLVMNKKRAVLTTLAIMLTVAMFFYQSIEGENRENSQAQLIRNMSVGDVTFVVGTSIKEKSAKELEIMNNLPKPDKDYWLKTESANYSYSMTYKPETLKLINDKIRKLPNNVLVNGQSAPSYFVYGKEENYRWLLTFFYLDPEKYHVFKKFEPIDSSVGQVKKALKKGEAVVTLSTAKYLNIKMGDVLKIASLDTRRNLLLVPASSIGLSKMKPIVEDGMAAAEKEGRTFKVKVGAIVRNNQMATAASIFMERKRAEKLLGQATVNTFEIKTLPGQNVSDLKKKVQALVDSVPKERTLEGNPVVSYPPKIEVGANQDITVESQRRDRWTGDPQGVILGLSFLAMIMAISISSISSTMTNSVVERKREFSIIQAIGGTPSQIKRMILLESTLLGLLGWLVGILAGVVIAVVASTSNALDFETYGVDFSLQIPWKLILASAIVTAAVGFVSGIYPSRKAALISSIGKPNAK